MIVNSHIQRAYVCYTPLRNKTTYMSRTGMKSIISLESVTYSTALLMRCCVSHLPQLLLVKVTEVNQATELTFWWKSVRKSEIQLTSHGGRHRFIHRSSEAVITFIQPLQLPVFVWQTLQGAGFSLESTTDRNGYQNDKHKVLQSDGGNHIHV